MRLRSLLSSNLNQCRKGLEGSSMLKEPWLHTGNELTGFKRNAPREKKQLMLGDDEGKPDTLLTA